MIKNTKRAKWTAIAVIFSIMVTLCLPVTSRAQEAPLETVPEGYIGIYDIADLYGIRNDLSANYILMNDIDMSEDTAEGGDWNLLGHGWTPIDGFAGTFDGNGHRIIGMHIYGKMGQDVGLFGRTSYYDTVIIRNLAMVNIDIDVDMGESSTSVGGIIGKIASGVELEKCYVSGNIVVQCSYVCDVGGLIGFENSSVSTLENAYSTCNISVNNNHFEGYSCVGGIAGRSSGVGASLYNIGLVERLDGGETYPINGLSSYVKTTNCYYLSGTTTKNHASGCTALFDTQLKDKRSLVGFDFDDVWEIDPYCDYPYPQLKSNRQIRIDSVDIVTEPDKTEYEQGDLLNLSGGTIKITYEDETTATIPIAEDMVSGYDMNLIGEQDVTVTYCGVSTSYPITVKEVPLTGIALNQSMVSLDRNQTMQLSVLYTPANASDKIIEWTSSDSTIAKVSETGLVTAKNKGIAIITATSTNGLVAKCLIEVLVPCATITIDKISASMFVGDTLKLTAQMLPLDTTDELEWKTSNASVADVANGTVTAYKTGAATITAYTDSGVSATCKITVSSSDGSGTSAKKPNTGTTSTGKLGVGTTSTGKATKASDITSVKGKIASIENVNSKSVKLTLSNLGVADGYQVEYSLKSNFKKSKRVKKKGTSITIKKLKKNKKYYFRARVYGKVNGKTYYGKWSAKKSIKVTSRSTLITNKKFKGTYGYNGNKGSYEGGWYTLTIKKITSSGKVRFQISRGGINGSPLYETNILTAKISGSKATFKYNEDGWGNKGKGTILFNKNGTIYMTVKQTYTSSGNRSTLAISKTIFKK